MFEDDVARGRESEPMSIRSARVERSERTRELTVCPPRPFVHHLYSEFVMTTSTLCNLRSNFDDPALRHRFRSIAKEVYEDLCHSQRIDLEGWDAGLLAKLEVAAVRAQLAEYRISRWLQKRPERADLDIGRERAGVSDQSSDQLFDPCAARDGAASATRWRSIALDCFPKCSSLKCSQKIEKDRTGE
jgi:hypothetical protein